MAVPLASLPFASVWPQSATKGNLQCACCAPVLLAFCALPINVNKSFSPAKNVRYNTACSVTWGLVRI